jgi:hypothetical protein
MINKSKNIIKELCDTFSNENEPFIKFLVAIFQFLLRPSSPERYIAISKQFQTEKRFISRFRRIALSIIVLNVNEEKLRNYYKDLYSLYEYYKSEEQYIKDLEELNKLINKNSRKVKNNPYKLLFWIDSNCDPTFERYLDSQILNEIKVWLQNRALSENALCLYIPHRTKVKDDDLELCELALGIIEGQLTKEPKRLKVNPIIASYKWPKVKTKKELLIITNHLKSIFEKVLENYSTIIDPQHRELEILYWSALSAGVINKKHMSMLYKIIRSEPDFQFMLMYFERAENSRPILISMFRSNNPEKKLRKCGLVISIGILLKMKKILGSQYT